MATLESLQTKIQRLQAQADALLAKNSRLQSIGAYGRALTKSRRSSGRPQPALYRDPKSGATWSGRARPPAWIADAKDRTKLLIDGATAGDKKPMVTKAVVQKDPTAKRISAKGAVSAKVPVKKAPAKKELRENGALTAPLVTVESAAESTT